MTSGLALGDEVLGVGDEDLARVQRPLDKDCSWDHRHENSGGGRPAPAEGVVSAGLFASPSVLGTAFAGGIDAVMGCLQTVAAGQSCTLVVRFCLPGGALRANGTRRTAVSALPRALGRTLILWVSAGFVSHSERTLC